MPLVVKPRVALSAGGGIATLVSDLFTDTDAVTLPNHTPDVRPGTNVWASGQTWAVLTNRAQLSSGAAGVNNVRIDSGQADCTIECDVTVAGANSYSGLVARASANDSALEIYFGVTEDNVYLYRNDAGTRTSIASAAFTVAVDTTYAVKVTLSGSSVKVDVGGTNYIDATSTFNQTVTSHGLFQWDNISVPRWDNFTVKTLL